MSSAQYGDALAFEFAADSIIQQKRNSEDLRNGRGIVVSRNTIYRMRCTFNAFVNQHQFPLGFWSVLVHALLHRQSDRLHLSFARGQAIARHKQVDMARP